VLRIRAHLLCIFFAASNDAQTPDQGYKLLLSPQRLRRLQRDRDRKTIRWLNFERRVQTGPDSPERGFELALYYAVTHDEARGREAVQWMKKHACDRRQLALVLDWCRDLMTDSDRALPASCKQVSGPITSLRDTAFFEATVGGDLQISALPADSTAQVLSDSKQLYALCEYLITARSLTHTDPRQQNATFFRVLPKEFLLSLKPDQIEHPDWMAHIAALALVAVDPNLEGSQFLQGWAMEESQMLIDGPGVAYEFLWADPYLPGIAYRNLDPWAYDPAGRLFARTDWDANSCWIAVDTTGMRMKNCSQDALKGKQAFGSLTLMPMSTPCMEVPERANRESLILWRMKPGQALAYRGEGKKEVVETADPAGMWLVAENVNGKLCQEQRQRP
jgi:hypothetical protein